MKIVLSAALFAVICFAAVWLNALWRERTLRKRWESCLAQAREIVAGVKAQYPGCEGALNAITAEPDARNSTAKDGDLAFEQYLDLLDMADPEDTPFYNSIGRSARGKNPDGIEVDLQNSQLSWGVDKLPDPIGAVGWGDNYAVQSTEFLNILTNQRKMGNVAQAYRRAAGVGWQAQAVTNVPGGGLTPRAQRRVDQLIKQDIECGLCSLDQVAAQATTSASTTGGTMAGFRNLVSFANRYTDAATGFAFGKATDLHYAPTAACLTGALASVFNYSAVKTIMRAMREAAAMGSDFVFLCGLDVRDAVTTMVDPATQTAAATGTSAVVALNGIRVFTRDQDDRSFGHSIGILKTDYGRVEVMETKRIGYTAAASNGSATAVRTDRVFIEKPKGYLLFHPEDWHLHWGVRFERGSIPDQGQGKSFFTRSLLSQRCKNPIRSASTR